jgi:hypothetical protein
MTSTTYPGLLAGIDPCNTEDKQADYSLRVSIFCGPLLIILISMISFTAAARDLSVILFSSFPILRTGHTYIVIIKLLE